MSTRKIHKLGSFEYSYIRSSYQSYWIYHPNGLTIGRPFNGTKQAMEEFLSDQDKAMQLYIKSLQPLFDIQRLEQDRAEAMQLLKAFTHENVLTLRGNNPDREARQIHQLRRRIESSRYILEESLPRTVQAITQYLTSNPPIPEAYQLELSGLLHGLNN